MIPITNTPITTMIISVSALILGLPFAIAAIVFNDNWVPDVILGSKTFGTGPGKTTTIEFGLLTGPNDAVYAGAIIASSCTTLFIIGVILMRHFTKHNGFGWLVCGSALLNLLSQIGCCAAAHLFRNKYPVATSTNQIQHVNGGYSTGGVLYTKEAWACSLNALYADSEGHWADSACSRFVGSTSISRTITDVYLEYS
jgi:hypothetical protein